MFKSLTIVQVTDMVSPSRQEYGEIVRRDRETERVDALRRRIALEGPCGPLDAGVYACLCRTLNMDPEGVERPDLYNHGLADLRDPAVRERIKRYVIQEAKVVVDCR